MSSVHTSARGSGELRQCVEQPPAVICRLPQGPNAVERDGEAQIELQGRAGLRPSRSPLRARKSRRAIRSLVQAQKVDAGTGRGRRARPQIAQVRTTSPPLTKSYCRSAWQANPAKTCSTATFRGLGAPPLVPYPAGVDAEEQAIDLLTRRSHARVCTYLISLRGPWGAAQGASRGCGRAHAPHTARDRHRSLSGPGAERSRLDGQTPSGRAGRCPRRQDRGYHHGEGEGYPGETSFILFRGRPTAAPRCGARSRQRRRLKTTGASDNIHDASMIPVVPTGRGILIPVTAASRATQPVPRPADGTRSRRHQPLRRGRIPDFAVTRRSRGVDTAARPSRSSLMRRCARGAMRSR